ncbi:gfo/Idh/MocA family oxidoreductase [candidate division KSB1 bacterium]|nr:gfo/Idh/MocA family oxidoreductase [candidate division KSB1 bacterium]
MKKLNWGLIGCGDISQKRVAPALRDLPECHLVAVNRARTDLAESFAREFGAKQWYADWQDLLNNKDIDAVYIATPVNLHAEQTIAAANAGKHILCEKPMAMNTQECDQMIAACKENNVKLSIAYYRHFYPVIERIKTILNSGQLGTVIMATINAFEKFDRKPGEPRYWLLEKEKSGGGPMMDFGCHRIEVLVNLLGDVTDVKSITDTIHYDRSVEDTASALIKFKAGMRGVLNVNHAIFESQDTLDIWATEGSIHVSTLNKGDLTMITSDGIATESHPPHKNVHLPHIQAFTHSVLNDTPVPVEGNEGKKITAILDLIYNR